MSARNEPCAWLWRLRCAGSENIRNYGRPAPPYVPEPYRFWSLARFGYVLVYDPQTEPVEILRLVHARRDLPQVLASLWPSN